VWDGIAAAKGKEVISDTLRITIALLTGWIIVPFWGTFVTLGSHKVVAATAGTRIVTGNTL